VLPIEYPRFEFDSDLTRAIIELERARADANRGTTPASVYFQLRDLFQLLTSIMSARIEGNRTSLFDAVSGVSENKQGASGEGVQEILNIQNAVKFIDSEIDTNPINHLFIREIHRIVVDGLDREGDRTPGAYRLGEVSIGQSRHRPPFPSDVPDHMSALIDFVAQETAPQMQLLQIAIAHHRFLWIHPFGNGNGRVARLVTYAMLSKRRFTSTTDYRTINPTAVFGADRQGYYDFLESADDLSNDGIVAWCTYVLSGLNTDLQKLAQLSDREFVVRQILIPALDRLSRAGGLTQLELRALTVVADKTTVRAADLNQAIPGSPSTRSQAIRRLIDRNLLVAIAPNTRRYQLVFSPNGLTVHLVNRLDAVGLLPTILREDPI